MSPLRALRCLLFACCALGFVPGAHAGDKYRVQVVPYVEPQPPGPDETLIYVVREKSGFGAAQKLAIIDNDTVVGVLMPGTFTYFKVPSGQHEIVGYFSPSPMVHYRVLPSPGKTVYLHVKVGYTTGLFMTPIEAQEAMMLMSGYKFTDIGIKNQKAKMNYKDYYDRLFQ
ncbi:MAG TPA: hypothetical protein VFP37_10510 [Steroidobacteraceae bacterium]|nr:hypothetical protein [Steroidobacteraceae bacterium]